MNNQLQNNTEEITEYIFKEKHRTKLPVSYFLLRNMSFETHKSIEKFAKSSFHNTNAYGVGHIYRPISNII